MLSSICLAILDPLEWEARTLVVSLRYALCLSNYGHLPFSIDFIAGEYYVLNFGYGQAFEVSCALQPATGSSDGSGMPNKQAGDGNDRPSVVWCSIQLDRV